MPFIFLAGLPVGQPKPEDLPPNQQPPPSDPASLLRQLRANGFTLEAMVPAFLHPDSVGLMPEFMMMAVKDEAEWSEFLERQGPDMMIIELRRCMHKYRIYQYQSQHSPLQVARQLGCPQCTPCQTLLYENCGTTIQNSNGGVPRSVGSRSIISPS